MRLEVQDSKGGGWGGGDWLASAVGAYLWGVPLGGVLQSPTGLIGLGTFFKMLESETNLGKGKIWAGGTLKCTSNATENCVTDLTRGWEIRKEMHLLAPSQYYPC